MIVTSVAYRQGKRLEEVPLERVEGVLAEPDTFVWIGLHEAEQPVLAELAKRFHLHELAVEDARKANQRSRLEPYDEQLFIAVKTVRRAGEEVEFGETHFFLGRNFLIAIRHGHTAGYTPVREHCERNPRLLAKGPGYPLYALLDYIVDNYAPVLEGLNAEFAELEERLVEDGYDPSLARQLYLLRRTLVAVRAAVEPVADIASQLARHFPELIHRDLRPYFRDVHDHVVRTLERLDALREMLTAAMSVSLALITVRQNEVVKRLAGWGAILAVPTVVFSLYGMNFRHMPELAWPYGYPLALAATAAACAALYRKLRRAGWL